jgi:hypothetical protein
MATTAPIAASRRATKGPDLASEKPRQQAPETKPSRTAPPEGALLNDLMLSLRSGGRSRRAPKT